MCHLAGQVTWLNSVYFRQIAQIKQQIIANNETWINRKNAMTQRKWHH